MKRKFVSFFFSIALLGAGAPAAGAESFTRPMRCSTDALAASVSPDKTAALGMVTANGEEDGAVSGYGAADQEDSAGFGNEAAPSAQPEIKAYLFEAMEALSCSKEGRTDAERLYPQANGSPTLCPPDKTAPEYSAAWLKTADDTMAFLSTEADDNSDLPEVPVVVNKSVQSYIKYFQTRGRKHFERWLGRSQDYMTMLRGILRENGLPEDLSYIAFIESGLNPTAKSRAKAVGMWQFIKGTAKLYGLRVDWWIDERMDPEKATYAAARYFKNLYDQFGSWYLAAASYNAGEGRVARAVRKYKSEDFWVIASRKKSLARETKEYVPKYLAAMLIAKDPTSYGFDAQEEPGEGLAYDKVKVTQATDLNVIAEAAGTTVEEIKRLNPELLRWFTPPNYPDYTIKIPAGKTEVFAENMSKIPPGKRITFLAHTVKRGDTVGKIAKMYGTTVNPILYINNFKSAKKTRLKPGSTIMIPVRAENGKGPVAEVVAKWEAQS
ncbi:MAG: transglycosylase SLT domain-containing protein [Deltaproteobacteria bacterium]|nr:transglycosylase SLT domain-containing protein [Deltaproteobacteria bacterium]